MSVLCSLLEGRIGELCPSVKTVGVAMDMDEIRSQKAGLPGVSVFYVGEKDVGKSRGPADHQLMMQLYGLQIVVKPSDLDVVLVDLRRALKGWAPDVGGFRFELFELQSTDIRDATGSFYWYEQVWRVPEHIWPV